jgi:hypothetical protein
MDTKTESPTASGAAHGSASGLLSKCAQAIRDLDRITPHPLSAEEQASAVLAVVFPQRTPPSECGHAAGYWQHEGDTFCRTCGQVEELCKPNDR